MYMRHYFKSFLAILLVVVCVELAFYLFIGRVKSSRRIHLQRLINSALKITGRAYRYERDFGNREKLRSILKTLSFSRRTSQSINFEDFTVVIDTVRERTDTNQVVSQLSKHSNKDFLKSMKVVVGLSKADHEKYSSKLKEMYKILPNVKFVALTDSEMSATKATRILLSYVGTRYVLIPRASDLFGTGTKELTRLLSPLVHQFVHVVGATSHNKKQGWDHGCFQGNLLWFQLILQKGYDTVTSDGFVKCYSIDGVFATHTQFLIQYFNGNDRESLYEDARLVTSFLSTKESDFASISLMYLDFFKTMNDASKTIELCVDCLFQRWENSAVEFWRLPRHHWLKFAQKHDISEIVLHPAIEEKHEDRHVFTCEDVGTKCHRKRKGMLAERCCLKKLHKLLMDTYAICEKYGLQYMSSDGTFLGAIKLTDTLPWDLDHDFEFRTNNLTLLAKHEDEFLEHGMIFKPEFEPCMEKATKERYVCGYAALKDEYWRLEVWGQYILFSDFYESSKLPDFYQDFFPKTRITGVATKIEMAGHWSKNRANPGLYARSCYGLDALKHEKHWQMSGKGNYQYTPSSRFESCPVDGYHACRNRYISDGNIQFKRPWV